jgi:hypothetical protein
VLPADSGWLTIKPVDGSFGAVTVPVDDGAFAAPALRGLRGRFVATWSDWNGRRFTREFTKDAGDYFLLLDVTAAAPEPRRPGGSYGWGDRWDWRGR